MSVDYKNKLYLKHETQVSTINNMFNGVDSAVDHLQQYSKEEKKDFDKRKEVATLNNFVARVVDSIGNIIFRKEINVEKLDGTVIAPYLDAIDYTNSLNAFGKQLLEYFERDGKTFILVDSPIYPDDVKSNADEIAKGLRPYMKAVERANVINWKYDEQMRLQRVTIKESYEAETTEFEENIKTQYRVLYYGGKIQIWREGEVSITIEAKYTDIPLVEIGEYDVPTLYDLARININHMNRGSELNNYIRIGAAPIPVTYGADTIDGEIRVIGINQGMNFNGKKNETGFEWVEMSGKNAEMIRNQMKEDEEAMLDIAVNLVTSNQPRTATEVNSDNIENESKLVSSAMLIENGLNKALSYFAAFLNTTLTEEQKCVVNKDFDSNKLTDEEVTQYRADYLAGIVSWDKFIDIMVAGKRYPKMSDQEKQTEKANLIDPGA